MFSSAAFASNRMGIWKGREEGRAERRGGGGEVLGVLSKQQPETDYVGFTPQLSQGVRSNGATDIHTMEEDTYSLHSRPSSALP